MAELNYEGLSLDDDQTNKLLNVVGDYFSHFSSAREDWDDRWRVADYMAKAAQNRTINAAEVGKGADRSEEPRANTGSTLFYRQHTQLAAQGLSVQTSRPDPWKYEPVVRDEASYKDGIERSKQLNTLMRLTRKKSHFDKKSADFWNSVMKYGSIPVMVYQHQELGTEKRRVPQREMIQLEDGTIEEHITGYSLEEADVLIKNHPDVEMLTPESLYADPFIGSIAEQNCVIYKTLINRAEVENLFNAEIFDPEKRDEFFEKIGTFQWDGSYEEREEKLNNRDVESQTKGDDFFLKWEFWAYLPSTENGEIALGEEDQGKVVYNLFEGTIIGNEVTSGFVVRFEPSRDPDGEIPICMINALPDDSDVLYHVSPAEIIRSNYSVECTLKNMAIDNIANINEPPIEVVEGMTHVKDFKYARGQVWPVMEPNSIKEFAPRDVSQATLGLLEYIKGDSKQALATDSPFMGEALGGRTSATEANTIAQNSAQPNLARVRYVLDQYLGFIGKKWKSYWDYFSEPGQVEFITEESQISKIYPAELGGEFEVLVSIVDEYEDDMVRRQQLNDLIAQIGQIPQMMEYINMENLLTEMFLRNKVDATGIVQTPYRVDSERVAREENKILMQGTSLEPNPEENLQVHLAEHKKERVRYQGVEDQYPQVTMLDDHIAKTEFLLNSKYKSSAQQGVPAGTAPDTPGQVSGDQMAGALGGLMGG